MALAPDFLFSFYYRSMLAAPMLAAARRGALNMHGSLLPRYRGRAPVNWAVLHGERETGATLHYMTEKPDDGDIVAQAAVPIFPDDTAREVFDKVTVAAEITLHRVLPALIAGTAPRLPQDPSAARYFGGRRPEDGTIDWKRDAASIHNLVRAVAPPYPGARTRLSGVPARVLRTRVLDPTTAPSPTPTIESRDGALVARCGGGGTLAVLALELAGTPCDARRLSRALARPRCPSSKRRCRSARRRHLRLDGGSKRGRITRRARKHRPRPRIIPPSGAPVRWTGNPTGVVSAATANFPGTACARS